MLKLTCIFVLFSQAAFAAVAAPTITAASGQIILPATATSLSGISISATGGNATTTFNASVVCNTANLTASGTNVSGSGTSSLAIGPDTSTQLSAAFSSLQITWPSAVISANDTCTVSASDNAGSAAPAQISIVVDGHKYLLESTLEAAQTRSQQQCAALGCDGVQTVYWWNVVTTTSGGAVQTIPGDPCFDSVTTSACGTTGNATSKLPANTGLSSSEQSSLVAATAAGLPTP